MNGGPFMFCDDQGTLFEVKMSHIATTHTLKKIAQECRVIGDAAHLAAAQAIDYALENGMIKKERFVMRIGDVAKVTQDHIDQQQHSAKYNVNLKGEIWSYEQTLVSVFPGATKSSYWPSHDFEKDDVGPSPKSWKWDAITGLMPHLSLLRKIARAHKLTLADHTVKKIDKFHKDFDEGKLKVRTPDAENDMGRCRTFVIFSEDDQKYIGRGGYACSNLAGAATYESLRAANTWIKKWNDRNNHYKKVNYVIIPVSMCVQDVPKEQLGDQGLALFQEALAQVKKEEMEQALKDCTIEQLEERLAQLGGSLNAASKPKRM